MTKRLLTARLADGAGPVNQDPGVAASGLDAVSDTPRRLLEAGVAAFAEQGFHGTTTREIATRAGLSPAGLYVHYPSKAALLGHLSQVGHEAAHDLVVGALGSAGSAPPVVRLHRVVEAFVRWHAEHHLVARVVQYELRALQEPSRSQVLALRRRMEARVEDVVTAGVADGTLRVEHPRQATRAILSLAVDVSRWFEPSGRETPQQLGGIYADLALRMLGADPAAVRRVRS